MPKISNNMIKKLLSNLKWFLLPATIIVCLRFLEAASDEYGISSDENGIMILFWILLIFNVALFLFDKKWKRFIDSLFH